MLSHLRQELLKLPKGLRTRFAPSPTGHLHLGHVASAIFVWGIAEVLESELVLRIEDHDQGRVRVEYEQSIQDDLAWLGLLNYPRLVHPFSKQSQHPERYQAALDLLEKNSSVYACLCSRKEIQGRELENSGQELRYDGHCRGRKHAWQSAGLRLLLEPAQETFYDLWLGQSCQTPSLQCGDLLLRDRDGNWTYNFAVTVDDISEGVELIIRGQDLFAASGRQLQTRRLLGDERTPRFLHHPLIMDDTTRKLSKRFGSTALCTYRQQGQSPEQVLGSAAFAVGLLPCERPLAITELGDLFRCEKHLLSKA